MLSHPITLISNVNPLQYLMTRPTLSGWLAWWSMILLQFEITYTPLRAIKGQAIADFLAAHPLSEGSLLNDDLPDEQILSLREPPFDSWEFYFDGAASFQKDKNSNSCNPGKAGIGLVFVTSEKGVMHFSYHLSDPCTNNEAEYEALIIGLELTILMEIIEMKIFGDSQLIINQVSGVYKVLNPKLLKCYQYAMKLIEEIPFATFYRVPCVDNGMADALAKLAKELFCPEEDFISVEVQGCQVLSPVDFDTLN